MLEVFGIVFEEEVLDSEIEALIVERQALVPIGTLRRLTVFVMNWRWASSSWIPRMV